MKRDFAYSKEDRRFAVMIVAAVITLGLSLFCTVEANANTMKIALDTIEEINRYDEVGTPEDANAADLEGSNELVTIQDPEVPLAGVIEEEPNFLLVWIGVLVLGMGAGVFAYCRTAKE